MRYSDAITKLFSLRARGVRMGIERMSEALEYRGFDAHAMPYIQVAGTNGKGSVSAMLAEGLTAAGHRVGLFTSPHLHRFTERICIDGVSISTREASRRITDVLDAFAKPGAPEVTFFELSTLMAVEAFRDHGCDVAVLEVGLGGRLDATNALPAVLSVITRIAFDHMEYLGNTLPKIAAEKAGIIKRGVPVIVGSREPAALRVIEARARRLKTSAWLIDRDFGAKKRARGDAFFVRVRERELGPFTLALAGEHQRDNAACAVAAMTVLSESGVSVPMAAMKRGLAKVRWPARLESIPGKPSLLLDAAHNPDGAAALAAHLTKLARSKRRDAQRVLLFGVMSDKQYAAMLRELVPCFDHIVYASPQLPRAATPEMLQQAHPGLAARSVGDGLRTARRLAGPAGLVVVAGSIFVVAEARAKLLRLSSDPLIRM